jgi:hypothetical protein
VEQGLLSGNSRGGAYGENELHDPSHHRVDNLSTELLSLLNLPSLKVFADASQMHSERMNTATGFWSTEVVSPEATKELGEKPFFRNLVGPS